MDLAFTISEAFSKLLNYSVMGEKKKKQFYLVQISLREWISTFLILPVLGSLQE